VRQEGFVSRLLSVTTVSQAFDEAYAPAFSSLDHDFFFGGGNLAPFWPWRRRLD